MPDTSKGQTTAQPKSQAKQWLSQWAWFVGLWLASITTLGVIALIIKWALPG